MRRVSLARYCPGLMVLMAFMLVLANPAWSAPATPLSNLAVAEAPVLDENASIEQLSERLTRSARALPARPTTTCWRNCASAPCRCNARPMR